MDDLLSEFLEETGEALEELDSSLVALERDPHNLEILEQIFRVVHTIKGTCGFLDLPRLESLSHATEDKLSLFREGKEPITSDGITLVLAALDGIKALLHQLGQTGQELAGHDRELIARLRVAAGSVSDASVSAILASDGDDGEPFEREARAAAGVDVANEGDEIQTPESPESPESPGAADPEPAFEADTDAETEEAEEENATGLAEIWAAVSNRTLAEKSGATEQRGHRFPESESPSSRAGSAPGPAGPEPEPWEKQHKHNGTGRHGTGRDEAGSQAAGLESNPQSSPGTVRPGSGAAGAPVRARQAEQQAPKQALKQSGRQSGGEVLEPHQEPHQDGGVSRPGSLELTGVTEEPFASLSARLKAEGMGMRTGNPPRAPHHDSHRDSHQGPHRDASAGAAAQRSSRNSARGHHRTEYKQELPHASASSSQTARRPSGFHTPPEDDTYPPAAPPLSASGFLAAAAASDLIVVEEDGEDADAYKGHPGNRHPDGGWTGLEPQQKLEFHGAQTPGAPGSAGSLRVNAEVVENLMTAVSELVLTRNQLLQLQRTEQNASFAPTLQRLNHITSELQENVIKTRMQPIGQAWSKLPRLVRDLARDLGKRIDLSLQGDDTELDRQLIEYMRDPLIHMVRNAADHGIEPPDVRYNAGKSDVGTIALRAFHEGGHIQIEVRDDGCGLDPDRIRQKLVAHRIVDPREARTLSDQRLFQYIFYPGFSTASSVTSVSGRGVGLDVVKKNIDKIGGSVEVHSEPGRGAVFIIKISLTLAIVSALIVRVGTEKFAIPQASITELVKSGTSRMQEISYIQGRPVLKLRESLLPLVSLHEILNEGEEGGAQGSADSAGPGNSAGPDAGENTGRTAAFLFGPSGAAEQKLSGELASSEIASQSASQMTSQITSRAASVEAQPQSPNKAIRFGPQSLEESFIVVTQIGRNRLGLMVNRVYDTEEIVVKPLSAALRHLSIFGGNTILGDGTVILILDPVGLAEYVGEGHLSQMLDHEGAGGQSSEKPKMSLLLFRAGGKVQKAVPLGVIARLEKIDFASVKYPHTVPMVQYRDGLMPLINVEGAFDMPPEGHHSVLVFSDGARNMGLVVDEILDVVENILDIHLATESQGILGSTLIRDEVTDILDAQYYWHLVFSEHMPSIRDARVPKARARRILFLEQDQFFRDMLLPFLSAADYRVDWVESVSQAQRLCTGGARFDFILCDTDIGYEALHAFVSGVRRRYPSQEDDDTTVIGLLSTAEMGHVEDAYLSDFSDFISKRDRTALLKVLREHQK